VIVVTDCNGNKKTSDPFDTPISGILRAEVDNDRIDIIRIIIDGPRDDINITFDLSTYPSFCISNRMVFPLRAVGANSTYAEIPAGESRLVKNVLIEGTTDYGIVDDGACTYCCLHPSTLVRTNRGNLMIADVRANDICYTVDNQPITIGANIRFISQTDQFTLIREGALGINEPSKDLLITASHPVVYKGVEVECDKLHNGTSIIPHQVTEPVCVYTLCTKERVAVSMQGAQVLTYEIKDFLVHTDSMGIQYEML
jgi:hypothetical protein